MAARANQRLRVVWLSVFLLLFGIFGTNNITALAVKADFKIFSQSAGVSNFAVPVRDEGYIRLTYKKDTVWWKSVGRFLDGATWNSNSQTYQSPISSSFNGDGALDGTFITCDGSYNIRFYDKTKNKIGTMKLIVYNTSKGTCDDEQLSSEFGTNEITPDNPPPTTPDPDESTDDTTTDTCDACAVFECPDWDEYMGKVDDIIDKIPQPPDWDKIIGKTEPKDVPPIKVPPLPPDEQQQPAIEKLKAPNIFEVLDEVDKQKPKAPEMDKSPDVGDFEDLDDVKPPKENKDDTGGFKIDNPVEAMDDGSNAPKPKSEDLPQPSTSDSLPTPTPSNQQVPQPSTSEKLQQPTTNQQVEQPSTNQQVQVPQPSQ